MREQEMTFDSAEWFLKTHYCDDDLDPVVVERDREHWRGVAADREKFPRADLGYIGQFELAASLWLTAEHGKPF
jgi:hypothetical protein